MVFVEEGVPGDLVELTDWTTRKKVARARIGRLVEASPDRVDPRCAHFGRCGGCQWQHIRYEAQLGAKHTMVRNALERIGGFHFADQAVSETVPRTSTAMDPALDSKRSDDPNHELVLEMRGSPDPYGYRARARLVEANGGFGYRVRGSREVEGIEHCPVLMDRAQDALAKLRQGAMSGSISGTTPPGTTSGTRSGTTPSTTPSTTPGEEASKEQQPTGSESSSTRKTPRAREWIVSAGSSGPAIIQRVRGKREARAISEFVTIDVLGEKLRASSTSFMQGNALLWDSLAEEVCRQCFAESEKTAAPKSSDNQAVSKKRFVELYAGIGFLTLPIARRGFEGVAIESDRSALSDLAFNLERAGLTKTVEIVRGRVESRRDLKKRLSKADLLIVDPPRVGLESTVRQAIAADGPSRVVYVSCDPATLARDLRVLAAGGYRLSAVCAMDLFPQTAHVEVVARLDR